LLVGYFQSPIYFDNYKYNYFIWICFNFITHVSFQTPIIYIKN
jgi:hypothetical protein